jgi:dolichol-phosphate mannosyltransferase
MDVKMDISVIIPFYNEEENLPYLIQELNTYFANFKKKKIEVIFVDDGSTDASIQKIVNSKRTSYKSKILKLSKNFGSHSAIKAGVTQANGEYIVMISADLQDPISIIGKLYQKCIEGYEIVIGQRTITKDKIVTKLFSKLYSSLMRKYVIKTYPANGFDIIMFSKKIKNLLNTNLESNSNIALQILCYGFNQYFIEYNKNARMFGKTKWSVKRKIKLLIDSFISFSFAPIRFVTVMGIIFSIGGFIWLLYIIIRTLLIGDLPQGWPALVSLLLIGFGITNISLGIVAEYLWRTLDASRKRPVFVIDQIIEPNKND